MTFDFLCLGKEEGFVRGHLLEDDSLDACLTRPKVELN